MVIDLANIGPNRRGFLAGLMAAHLIPRPTWADAGSPAYLSTAALPDGFYVLCGIGSELDISFQITLPDRGHAAAAHPTKPQSVAFARRPGTFAIVVDCITGKPEAFLQTPDGRHFYGHGAFSADGNWLFTTENDYEAGQGRIGVWDVTAGYKRADEFSSGGVGPHDIKRLPDSDVLVVANGGIDTHPDSGRTMLNIPTMAPNLTYFSGGVVQEAAELAPELHKNSIRHLAVSSDGQVAFGMQRQGGAAVDGLVGTHKQGQAPVVLRAPEGEVHRLQAYIGSIAFGADNRTIAATSPRGGCIQLFDAQSGAFTRTVSSPDASGVAARGDGFLFTSGEGIMQSLDPAPEARPVRQPLAWDNHLISI